MQLKLFWPSICGALASLLCLALLACHAVWFSKRRLRRVAENVNTRLNDHEARLAVFEEALAALGETYATYNALHAQSQTLRCEIAMASTSLDWRNRPIPSFGTVTPATHPDFVLLSEQLRGYFAVQQQFQTDLAGRLDVALTQLNRLCERYAPINVSTMDVKSFLDQSAEISAAVRDAINSF